MVGAGRFERPTPCAQGSFRPPKKMPYSQLLTFQADGATLLQLVAPCGTRRLSPATILSTVGFHQRLDLGLHLRAGRDCHLPAAGVFLVARGFVDRSREEPFPRRPFRANVRVADKPPKQGPPPASMARLWA